MNPAVSPQDAFQPRINRTNGGSSQANERTGCLHEVLDQSGSAPQMFIADMLTEQTCYLEGDGIWLAALPQEMRHYLENQNSQDISGDKGEQDTCAVFEDVAPLYPGVRQDRDVIVQRRDGQHGLDTRAGGEEPQYQRSVHRYFMQDVSSEAEQKRDRDRCKAKWKLREIENDGDKYVRDDQQR